jgi:hypothetical protein
MFRVPPVGLPAMAGLAKVIAVSTASTIGKKRR